ncbi:hypothetical protein COV05_03265 [Candidatus Uhrbacteria bacterium CG10_big_fil_rev_8_21_14_0_10_48_16]|uniref:M23ase beta-sheet core domain-containing protein n=1 Tax=Candidatus Uhrbacteria bacterium CG10_big_fil_rev_8_21_14_0_10_48_16 TaxID=1975038 RepID=A0A2M8LGW0_9BACT|nr:MAG: hypothetical protein COV05_03265 [Candidatus Uhrbacteria bacterium CG10_big_fil_rev_8_21_14_0_10_48_16]
MRYLILGLFLVGVGCLTSVTPSNSPLERGRTETTSIPLLGQEGLGEVAVQEEILLIDAQILYKGFGEYFEDRFSGYHVAIDLEAPADTPVYAIDDGKVTYATTVSGYGGVMIVRHEVNDRIVSAIYGHLDPASMRGVGESVAKGEQLAVLGEEGEETDGEREHLHFAMYEGDEIRLQGYETVASAVNNWLNPIDELRGSFTESDRYASDLGFDEEGEALFQIDFEIPYGWDIEYIPSIQALNLYTLSGEGTARERSQILIRYFDASSFLTLSNVTIHSVEDAVIGIGDYVARRYDIEKKSGITDFADQPSWRNERHRVTDFRLEEGYTRYYVVAGHPDLDPVVYETVLASMREIE